VLIQLPVSALQRRTFTLGAKNKLNAAAVNGSLIFAGVMGIATESWGIFLVAFLIFLATSVIAGDIRK
jgi:hypothetical protein